MYGFFGFVCAKARQRLAAGRRWAAPGHRPRVWAVAGRQAESGNCLQNTVFCESRRAAAGRVGQRPNYYAKCRVLRTPPRPPDRAGVSGAATIGRPKAELTRGGGWTLFLWIFTTAGGPRYWRGALAVSRLSLMRCTCIVWGGIYCIFWRSLFWLSGRLGIGGTCPLLFWGRPL